LISHIKGPTQTEHIKKNTVENIWTQEKGSNKGRWGKMA